jgi:hypothetical protein
MRAHTITTKALRRPVLLVGAAASGSLQHRRQPTSAPQVVGTFVSHNATEVWNQPETGTGQTGVPGLKANCAS